MKKMKKTPTKSLKVAASSAEHMTLTNYIFAILGALENDKYKARTIKGIAKEIHQSEHQVLDEMKKNPELRKQLKVYPRKNTRGDILFTTKKRFYEEASTLDKFLDMFISTSSKEVK